MARWPLIDLFPISPLQSRSVQTQLFASNSTQVFSIRQMPKSFSPMLRNVKRKTAVRTNPGTRKMTKNSKRCTLRHPDLPSKDKVKATSLMLRQTLSRSGATGRCLSLLHSMPNLILSFRTIANPISVMALWKWTVSALNKLWGLTRSSYSPNIYAGTRCKRWWENDSRSRCFELMSPNLIHLYYKST